MQVCKSWEELLYFLSSIRRIFCSSPISSSGFTSSSFVPHISMSCRCLNRGVRVSPSVLGTPISYMVSECTYTGLLDLFQLSSWISWKTCHSCDFENLQKRTRNCFSTLDASCNTSCNSYEASVVWSKHVSCLCHMGDLYHRSCSFVFDMKHARKQMQRVPCQAQRQDILCVCQSSLWHVSLQYTAE